MTDNQHITTNDLLNDLQRLTNELNRVPRTTDITEHSKYSLPTYYNRFNSWTDALEQAGLNAERVGKNITRDALLDDLRRLADKLNRVPRTNDVREHGEYSYPTYRNQFGSWNNALDEAGFNPERAGKTSTIDLLDDLQRLANELNRVPTTEDIKQHSEYSYPTYYYRLGGLKTARELAGIHTNQRQHSTVELLSELYRLTAELGHTPTTDDMTEHGQHSAQTYRKRFDSWTDALDQAGLEQKERADRVSDEEYLDTLREFADELDRTPRWQDMEASDYPDPTVYRKHFGSWNNALEQAGLEPNTSGVKIPNRVLLADLQRVAAGIGHSPTEPEYNTHGHFWLPTLRERFGTIGEARTRAGITDDGTIHPEKDLRDTVDLTSYIEQNANATSRSPSREDLLDELHRLAGKLNKTPSIADLRTHGKYSHAPFYTEFGDWVSALDAAGFDTADRQTCN